MSVSVTMGVMNSLLGKLATLAGDEYSKLKGVRKTASYLEKELSAMYAALEKMELMDQLDPGAKDWRDHVREMSYDMENCIDDFMRQFGGAHAKAGFIKKTTRRLKTLRHRHQIAERMDELKVLALEANERRLRYKIDDCVNSASSKKDDCVNSSYGVVAVDPRMAAIYKDAAGLVGIDGPKKELVGWLTDNEKKLKVVSVVGFGGLGKTTLAKQVYDEIEGNFSCKAFVSVSQRPDMASLLNRLQLKLGMKEESRETQDIIDSLREHLTHRRYLIVVDDLWDQPTWNIISCAFKNAGNGSRVIVTTRLDDVAVLACSNDHECIYRMKSLREQDSRRLFFNRIFGSEDGCPPQLKGVSAEILKKCRGLPLAIITIASCQARSRDEWESIRNSLGAQFAVKPTLDEMRSILNLSYMHLPLYLRPCFLYLGMYPEDREIQRDDLVRQWVAEGFVSDLHGKDKEVAAGSYLNELVNRSLIQPERNKHGELLSCRVHDMMLDLILSKCKEDNFLRVECSYKDMTREHGWKYKVRRISLNLSVGGAADGTASEAISSSLSQVRSLANFGTSKYILPLLHFKYLRVILFEISQELCFETIDLEAISQLFQLRYLKVSAKQDLKLPTEIQGLVHLETLELDSGWREIQIPSDIVHLPRLSNLIIRLVSKLPLPKGIRNMKSLHTLCGFDLGCSSSEDIEGLGELTNLRCLRLSKSAMGNLGTAGIDALVSSIGMLHDLRYLCIDSYLSDREDKLGSLSDPPRHIKVLELGGWRIPRVPKWVCGLQCLSRLQLDVEETSADEFHALGELLSLVSLCLFVRSIPKDRAVIFSAGLFPALEEFECSSTHDDVTAYLAFEAGAMPKLERLELRFGRWGGTTPVGLEHLLSLEHITVFMIPDSVGIFDEVVRDAESAFKKCTQLHPSRQYSPWVRRYVKADSDEHNYSFRRSFV